MNVWRHPELEEDLDMVFCDSVFFPPKKLRSGVTNYTCDRDARKGSGKEIFADFSH